MAKSKPKFRVGQEVSLPMRIIRMDRRRPILYTLESVGRGWIMGDDVAEDEIRPHRKAAKRGDVSRAKGESEWRPPEGEDET